MKRILTLTALSLICSTSEAVNFKVPNHTQRLRAIGSTEGLPLALTKALSPQAFEPVPVPGRHDWLAVHRETGQTFDDFVRRRPNRPQKTRNKIYLQPLGDFPETHAPPLDTLKQYAPAYFAIPVKVLAALALDDSNITTRINAFTRKRQILTDDVLVLLRKKLPEDAFCLLAITMDDLYPDPSWNFVFGQASLRERVGVYSFARYDPAFYGQKRTKDYEKLLLRRSCKVLVHETAHMFGLHHCIYFRCVLNGSNHLAESDSRPLHLCPVCLRKLQHSIGFDVTDRYAGLFHLYGKTGFNRDARWVEQRLIHILGAEAAQAAIKKKNEH
ncbi:MAG: archaemetzincin [Planctomycetota bacterium]